MHLQNMEQLHVIRMWLSIRPWLVIYLFPVPFLAPQPCGRAVIIINVQKLIIYYTVYDAIGRQNLNTQQDITASSSACRLPFSADPRKPMLSFVSKWGGACRLCIIIILDAGIKIACGRGTGNNYITSRGLNKKPQATVCLHGKGLKPCFSSVENAKSRIKYSSVSS